MTEILVAAFGSLTAFFGWRAAAHGKQTRRNMQTNHGTTTGYKIEQLVDRLEAVNEKVDSVDKKIDLHTAQDEKNFAALSRQVAQR